jgi:hypothetical protein
LYILLLLFQMKLIWFLYFDSVFCFDFSCVIRDWCSWIWGKTGMSFFFEIPNVLCFKLFLFYW